LLDCIPNKSLMKYSFLIVGGEFNYLDQTLQLFHHFPDYFCVGVTSGDNAIEQICELKPQLVIVGTHKDSGLSLSDVQEMHQYINPMPYIIVISDLPDRALEALQSGVSDYLISPISIHNLGKSLFKFSVRNKEEPASIICVKSYSDYNFISLQNIIYLKADNNTTDIILCNNKQVIAYKSLKYFEGTLPFYFFRIHKSYIVNINHVSRIHFSKSKCYVDYNIALPFSNSYKDNIDAIIRKTNII